MKLYATRGGGGGSVEFACKEKEEWRKAGRIGGKARAAAFLFWFQETFELKCCRRRARGDEC